MFYLRLRLPSPTSQHRLSLPNAYRTQTNDSKAQPRMLYDHSSFASYEFVLLIFDVCVLAHECALKLTPSAV